MSATLKLIVDASRDGNPNPSSPETTILDHAYGFPTMVVTCLRLKPLAVPATASFPVHTVSNARRHLATAAPWHNQFPYPSHPQPTPSQIFHLPIGASQKQVKSRCGSSQPKRCARFVRLTFSSVATLNLKDYELVRVHHPDSPHSRASDLPKRVRDERFSEIKDAYDVLTGKKPGHPSRWSSPDSGRDWEFRNELDRRRHRRASWGPQAQAYSQSHYGYQSYTPPNTGPMTPEDRRRDNILICVAFAVRLLELINSRTRWLTDSFSPL
jgi:hypothetical protein